MAKTVSFKRQIKNNLIALISIFIAISSLAYNTWRNEQTEYNRNIRTSSFEIIKSLAQLQLLVDYAHYDATDHDSIKGWSHVLYIRDLTTAMSEPSQESAQQLFAVWQRHFSNVETEKQSIEAITVAITDCREQVLLELRELK
ncbi:hypothetical protein [Thalassotalea sp. PS06]|uniref:hypothetical protein n=1 Tax=Thalassotalea sp. PS06 TaxID=2594005 RepID=UPI00163DA965|nr:hypothetical protein [Thalassotalea sp. PS06]